MLNFNLKPLLTEKNDLHRVQGVYAFAVPVNRDYFFIKQSVEKLFDVKVERINFILRKPKPKRIGHFYGKRKQLKIALIKLKKGFNLDFLFKKADDDKDKKK
jgi:large subunit ribosomal protein L23